MAFDRRTDREGSQEELADVVLVVENAYFGDLDSSEVK